ncbi:isochorismate synthase [Pelagicoccus sp. SDUM812005]|uniref:isochorismate synthase n=1 Tax=Pelagicoccus sp. SDUM812005 TaxID=3041257 RepID=UPI0028105CE8|nr:isochorismate synthase [Pelagicoccus sp. SDUM812005]MDQ8179816.1 isochorismate synthase [Pelagicoccus sp. SDUM812005]
MDTIQLDPSKAKSYEALHAFLQGCQFKAVEKGHAQLVSIAAESSILDPLAVLESIYEERQQHFYIERRRDDLAIAGAEAAVSYSPAGSERFASVKDWIAETLDNAIAVGDANLPFFGPHFFCGFTFFDEVEHGTPFPASSVFVPRWQVVSSKGRCVAIANATIAAGDDIEAVAKRIWNANTKFRTFDYTEEEARSKGERLKVLETRECGGENAFQESVGRALERIEAGEFQKIVLARALDLKADQAFHPLEILNTLRERYEDCYAFSIANGLGQSFIGASPERLVSVSQGRVNVDVLAGTAPRGKTASEDARFGAGLLESEKDRREHKIVHESVCRRLQSLGLQAEGACNPVLKKLQNVQHLFVDVEAELPAGIHLLDLVAELHPTPAVGGMPREAAVPRIKDHESFDRGLYAGPIGWLNAKGEGEFLVGIRSALVDGDTARLYAGVGVVEGSVPEREHLETNLKFQALKENLL